MLTKLATDRIHQHTFSFELDGNHHTVKNFQSHLQDTHWQVDADNQVPELPDFVLEALKIAAKNQIGELKEGKENWVQIPNPNLPRNVILDGHVNLTKVVYLTDEIGSDGERIRVKHYMQYSANPKLEWYTDNTTPGNQIQLPEAVVTAFRETTRAIIKKRWDETRVNNGKPPASGGLGDRIREVQAKTSA